MEAAQTKVTSEEIMGVAFSLFTMARLEFDLTPPNATSY